MHGVDRNLAHQYILTELMIRTLERDRKYMEPLKMKSAMDKLFNKVINEAKAVLLDLKNQMGKIGLKLHEGGKIDEDFTKYIFVQRGVTDEIRYSNIALRNPTMRELERLFKL